MGQSSSENVIQVCQRYREEWKKGLLPRIFDFVPSSSDVDHHKILRALIELDIELRLANDSVALANDYLQLGPEAVEFATSCLRQPNSGLHLQENEKTTAFAPIEVNDDVSENYSFDVAERTSSDELLDHKQGQPLSKVGRYKLLQEIGVGGMGAVWMAEQQEPVRRRVALKVIRADIGSKSAVARFEAERQAIALMDHQNIAKILDAGTTETGNPYFVMELVKGMPLNKYCDKYKLSVRERLELMIPVCRAVQHAHQKGIIHRDLKHSNVLVTEYDGKPTPKVIDFGLAKALGHKHTLTDKTMFTEIGKVVGTLQYMSPEQAETNNVDVDTRTDIYSLGVMIYKLLTGVTPLENATIVNISLLQALQIIREKDPSRPSVRLKEDDSIDQLCTLRKVQKPEKLRQILEGDLDWIVMKSLEKDRRDRYETADAMAMDLERFLNDEPVLARPHSGIYTIKKFIRRNRGLVAALSVIASLLIGGIVATSSAMWWARTERDRAESNFADATKATERAEAAVVVANTSEQNRKLQQELREIELYSMRLKSAWSNWQLGDSERAWGMLNLLENEDAGWERDYLRSEFTSIEKCLYGHAKAVGAIAVSSDGKMLATAAEDNTIRLWDAKSKKLIHRYLLNDEAISLRFSNDSQTLYSVDYENKVCIWSTDSPSLKKAIGPFKNDLMSLAVSPDSKYLFVGSATRDSERIDGDREFSEPTISSIRVIEIATGATIQELSGHSGDIVGLSCSPDGSQLASGSFDKTICVWFKEDDEFVLQHRLSKHFREVTNVEFSPDGTQVASSSKDGTARIWDSQSGELIRTIYGHSGPVNDVSFDSQGERVVTASADRTARIWTLEGEGLVSFQGHYDVVLGARFSVGGEEIFTIGFDKTVRSWSANGKLSTVPTQPHTDTVWDADFDESGRIAVSASEDGFLSFIDTSNGKLVGDKIPHEEALLCVTFSPDSKYVAYGGADFKLRIVDVKSRSLVKVLDAHDNYIWDVQFSADGKFIATASADNSAKVWKTEDWELVKRIDGHEGEVASVDFSPDGSHLLTASDDHSIKLWDTHSFDLLETFAEHNREVWRARFSPTGQTFASSGYDGEVILWDVTTRKPIRRFKGHKNQVAGLAFSVDGKRLVTASDDKTIRIWDIDSAIELFSLQDKGDFPIVHVSFSKDGMKLISGNSKGWVTIRSALEGTVSNRAVLPETVELKAIQGLPVARSKNSTEAELRNELEKSLMGCSTYPSFKTFRNAGMAQYRLGQYQEAIESLREALRLEPIQYGQSDIRPDLEAFYSMALVKSGQLEEATKVLTTFKEKINNPLWVKDSIMLELIEEVEQVFLKQN